MPPSALGGPLWTPQLEADRILFFGHVPLAWLQGNLVRPDGRVAWWEIGVFTVYVSHFFAALMLALFLWFRSRPRFAAFVTQVGITMLIGLALYVLIPAAPPWAAGRCTAEEVQNTVDYPSCMLSPDPADPSAVLLPTEGAGDGRGHVQRLTTRGIQPGLPGLDTAFYDASHRENLVAAIPSLHAAFSLLVAIHLFRRKSRVAMIAIIAYPSAMGFTLVWTGDHYVVDILLGWVVALFAYWISPGSPRCDGHGSPAECDPEITQSD